MNFLSLGFGRSTYYPDGPFLLIDDEKPDIPDWKQLKTFDPTKHRYNFFDHPSDKVAREYREIFYSVYPQGSGTLTVRNGKWSLLPLLKNASGLKEVHGSEEVDGLINDMLESEVLRDVFCGKPNFSFDHERGVFARINRAELGEDVALILGLILISHYRLQKVIPDFGFYARPIHRRQIRENNLMIGVDQIDDLPKELQGPVMKMPHELRGVTVRDAERFAEYDIANPPHTVEHNDYIKNKTA